RAAESAVDPAQLAAAHDRYAAERDAELPDGWTGPRPAGGVGGTRQGVKCLHAHYAFYLAGGDDPVGRWVADRLASLVAGRVAPVDCAPNSTRPLVAGPDAPTRDGQMHPPRLGQRVDRERRLDPAAIARTVAVLRRYRTVMDGYGARRVRVAATSAGRDASN